MEGKVKWVRLGDYIEQCDERNETLQYGLEDVMGMTITKEIIPTKANLSGNDLSKFKIVYPNEFIYNPRTHGKKIGLGFNSSPKPFLISWNNTAFRICDVDRLLPLYLYIYFNRDEWDRLACYNSWGSSTEVFSWDELCRMDIPLPSKEDQQKVVNVWKTFREIKEQNEAKAAPLMQVCLSYMQFLKHKYPMIELGPYIEESNERNRNLKFGEKDLMGVCSEGTFIKSIANTSGLAFGNYKVVHKGDFAYSNRINVGSIALRYDGDCIISPSYAVFRVKPECEELLQTEFLAIWFRRSEFLRSTLFFAYGTIKDDFSHREMQRVQIPLPPPEVQQAIVNVYKCANEAKQIAAEADRLSREVCPALLQHIIHN